MKKIAIVLSSIILFADCKGKKDIPDVSNIKVNCTLERFDQDFFAIDSNNVLTGLNNLNKKYPLLTNIFLQNILGLDSAATLEGAKRFLHQNETINNAIQDAFKNTDWLKQDFIRTFQFVKFYFPTYELPEKIITVAGPPDALARTATGQTPDFLGPGFLGVSLQFYLGKNYLLYKDAFFIENIAPEYRSRRFSKEYIIADAMQLIVDDIFPDKSGGQPLIEQMIEKGKQWYLLDQFLPEKPDSIKTGYTSQQLEWCKENEGLIWSYIIKSGDLNSINPVTIQTFIGEGPFTQGFSQELSPGNLGQWVGWQIVKKFVTNNPAMKPEGVMNTEARKILEEAKYKPK